MSTKTTTRPASTRRRHLRSVATASRAELLCEEHGSALYLCALLMTGDHEQAVDAVAHCLVQADLDPTLVRGADHLDARRELARLVYAECHDLTATRSRTQPSDGAQASDQLTRRLARITRHSREALALCVYGGHTAGQAATVLGFSRDTAHHFLMWGLRDLEQLEDEATYRTAVTPERSSPAPMLGLVR